MKNKGIGKRIAVAVCMGLMVIAATPSAVMAKIPEQIQPMAEYILSSSASLEISSNGVAKVEVNATSRGNVSISIEAKLQRRIAERWEVVKVWTAEGKGNRTSVSETYSVSKGTYRVYATVKAGSETKYPTSATKIY